MRTASAATRQPGVAEIIGAAGPNPEHRDALMLFGQFVGSWDVESTQFAPDGRSQRMRGEWHFFWALEGRAIQDVILTPPRTERDPTRWQMGDYQTAVRFYRPTDDTWTSQRSVPYTTRCTGSSRARSATGSSSTA